MANLNIVLMGAGASSGCGSVWPKPPPVGNDLIQEIESYCPEIMRIIKELIKCDEPGDFEEMMAVFLEKRGELIEERSEFLSRGMDVVENSRVPVVGPHELNRVMAAYFSRFCPDSMDNAYVRLIETLGKKQGDCVYSTLNYDCIAEHAANLLQLAINYWPEKMPSGRFDILKLHGSCNFLANGAKVNKPDLIPLDDSTIDSQVTPIIPVHPGSVANSLDMGLLAMSFYMKGKRSPVASKFVKAIQSKWKELVGKADRLVIIGINPNTGDSHIWDPIINTNADVGFVGSRDAFETLEKARPDVRCLGKEFAKSIAGIGDFVG